MHTRLVAALVALPLATASNAANLYSACSYQDDMGKLPITQLFKLKGDGLSGGYRMWSYEEIREWEEQFATEPDSVRDVSGYSETSIVGQFSKFAEAEKGQKHGGCMVTTSKDHALAWFRSLLAKGRLDTVTIANWRPTKSAYLSAEDWSGNGPSEATNDEPQAEATADESSQHSSESAASSQDSTLIRPKKSKAQADAEFEAAQAVYKQKLAEQQKQVEDYKRAQDEFERKKAEQKLAAERIQAEYQRQLAEHAEAVKEQQKQFPGGGGRFQATSGFLETREAALESLNKHPGAANGLSDVQCKQVTFYSPPKWTCWGFYRQQVKPAGASAQ